MRMFRLFGNLWLDDPPKVVSVALDGILPLIQNLEQNIAQGAFECSAWDIDAAFESYRAEEIAWWTSNQVDRPLEYLLRPSGCLDAPVACHLFNPTFAVDDPYFSEIDDASNPCIAQLHDAGFSSKTCLMFDHSSRREDSTICKVLYPPDLWDIHEKFVFTLRHHMKALVEICWGGNVRERMFRYLPNTLRILPLWGRYQGIDLYLELNEDQSSARRFVVFVNHPQFFMFMKGTNTRAQAFRAEQGARQDLLLEVAARIGNIDINTGFYKSDPRLLRPYRPGKATRDQIDALKGQAYGELKVAFPTANFDRLSKRQTATSPKSQKQLQNTSIPVIEHDVTIRSTQAVEEIAAHNDLEESRSRKIAQLCGEIHALALMFIPDAPVTLEDRSRCETLVQAIEISYDELYHWKELPETLARLVQTQNGLQIDRHPIASREDAETAYRLLHCQGNPECLSIVGLIFSILIVYTWNIRRKIRDTVDELMILRALPDHIVPRVCSFCGKGVLDDPFPYFAKNNPDYYVVKRSSPGCGLVGCTKGVVLLHPLRRDQKYIRALRVNLENLPNPRVRGGAPWERYFLRNGENELRGLPGTIQIKCPLEGCEGTGEEEHPRWTVHPVATIVRRNFKCPSCGRRGDWKPADTTINHVSSESLSRTWSRFKNKGCDLTKFPRLANVYFSQSHINIRIAQLKEAKKLADKENLS